MGWTCITEGCHNPVENQDTGLCASCSKAQRKADKEASKPKKKPVRIKKVGTSNTFECSDGERVTQADINSLKDKIYRVYDAIHQSVLCEGCEAESAQGHAHIIAQARCKVIRKTELIWELLNMFKACHKCNSAIENPKGQEWKKLKNIDRCMKFIMTHDPELYVKFQLNAAIKEEHPTGEINGLKDFIEPHKI